MAENFSDDFADNIFSENIINSDDSDGENAEKIKSHMLSIADLRDKALAHYHEIHCAALRDNGTPFIGDLDLEAVRQYLSLQEATAILLEFCEYDNGKLMGICGHSRKEVEDKLQQLFVALCKRIRSNVAAEAVKDGMLDVEYDSEQNDFVFSMTEQGKAAVGEYVEGNRQFHIMEQRRNEQN